MEFGELMLKQATKFAWAAFVLSVIAVCWVPAGRRFPAVFLSTFVFSAVLSWLPRCRVVVAVPLCPWNWALFVFFLQLVALPLLITLDGASPGVLPFLPSPLAINLAMVLNCIAFIAVCAVYNHFSKFRTVCPDWLDRLRNAPDLERYGSRFWVVVAALFGFAGLLLSFGNLAGILDYFNDPSFYKPYLRDMSSTWRGLAALLLKPFLGFAVVMTWCEWMDRGYAKASWLSRAVLTIATVAGIVFSFSFFSYNRGAFAVPLVAVAAVAMANGNRSSSRIILTTGVLILALLPAYALYRTGTETGDSLLARPDLPEMIADNVDIPDLVQTYAVAPQYLGFLLERSHWGRDPHWGVVTVSSILSPLPVLGKSFRQRSGTAIHNRLIYGTDAIADQYPPFVGETFLDFHLVGVVFGGGFLGWILHRLQSGFERSRSSLDLYIWQYLSIWICFVIFGAIDVTSQILIYFCWPIYLFLLRNRMRRRLSTPLSNTSPCCLGT